MLTSTIAARMRRIEDHVDHILLAEGHMAWPEPAAWRRWTVPALFAGVMLLIAALGFVTTWWFVRETREASTPAPPRVAATATAPSANMVRIPRLAEEPGASPDQPPLRQSARRTAPPRRRDGGVRLARTGRADQAADGSLPNESSALPGTDVAAALPAIPTPLAPPPSVDKLPAVTETSADAATAAETEAVRRRAARQRSFDALRLLRNQ